MAFAINLESLKAIDEIGGAPGSQILKKVLDAYVDGSKDLLKSIVEGASSADFGSAKRAAHALKSTSALIGAFRLAEICKVIEISNLNQNELLTAALGARVEFESVIEEIKSVETLGIAKLSLMREKQR